MSAAGGPRFVLRVEEQWFVNDLDHATGAAQAAIEPLIATSSPTGG